MMKKKRKYASVIFVVLLAADRYCAMCRPNLCVRYRNYRTAISSSAIAWCLAFSAAIPLYLFSEVVELRKHNIANGFTKSVCIAKWPSSTSARWYITFSSIFIYVIPLVLMIYFNYHILKKLREALHGSRRLKRESKSRAPYHRVTCLVLWVVIFHVVCWSPFWLFNLLSSVFRLRIHTRFGRLVINVIHLFPYINCALNPLLYATHAENFRTAFRSLIVGDFTKNSPVPTMKPIVSQAIVRKRFLRHTVDPAMIVLPILRRLAVRRKPKVARCNDRSHSIFVNRPLLRASLEVKNLTEHFAFDVCNQQESQKNIMLHHNSSKMCDAENRNRKNYLFHWSCNKNKRISKHLPNVGQLQHHSLQPNERCKNGNSFTLTTVLFTSDESSVL